MQKMLVFILFSCCIDFQVFKLCSICMKKSAHNQSLYEAYVTCNSMKISDSS